MYGLKLNQKQWAVFSARIARHEAATYSNPRGFADDAMDHAGTLANSSVTARGVRVIGGLYAVHRADALAGEIG